MTANKNIMYVDSDKTLKHLCDCLKGSDWVALDTEFLREKTYYPQLCLLQVATPEIVACVDAIAMPDMTPLLDWLYQESVVKVFHAARQDLEIFYHLTHKPLKPVFDTQIAAPLLGYADQIGYANLVHEILHKRLSKSYTRTDWSRRPLSAAQLQYATDDVIYLVDIYQKIKSKLLQLGRFDWLCPDFEYLTDPTLYNNFPEVAWQRVKGLDKLNDQRLSIVQQLAEWREVLAKKDNRPRSWILKDDVIIDIAKLNPHHIEELTCIRGMPDKVVQKLGDQIIDVVQRAEKMVPIPLTENIRPASLSPMQNAIVDALMAVVRLRGLQNSLNPTILSSRKQLEKLVSGNYDVDILHGWRHQMIGEDLLAILNGQANLMIKDQLLIIEPSVSDGFKVKPSLTEA